MTDLQATMAARRSTHGDFTDVASVDDQTLRVWEKSKNWSSLSHSHRAALRLISHKVARILSGDADEPEHWHDGAGYFTLGEGRCSSRIDSGEE